MVQSSDPGLQFQHNSEGRQAPEDGLENPSFSEYATMTAVSHLAATFHCSPEVTGVHSWGRAYRTGAERGKTKPSCNS